MSVIEIRLVEPEALAEIKATAIYAVPNQI
jgi:hypothetical protein